MKIFIYSSPLALTKLFLFKHKTYREKPQKTTTYRPEALSPFQKDDFQQTKSWELPQNSATFAGLGCITV